MSGFGDSVWVFRSKMAETGNHPRDLLVELHHVTLVGGTIEVPTQFADGNIVHIQITQDHDTINGTVALAADATVTSGKITVVGPTASTASFWIMVIGRTDV